jgi:outer membrane protein assembly factor BamB
LRPFFPWIYSSPTIYQGCLYIGDRKGFLHCLDSNTGELIWSKRTNSDENDDVNSTPAVANGLVVAPTNAKVVVAYEAVTGKDAWEKKVDGPRLLVRSSIGGLWLSSRGLCFC